MPLRNLLLKSNYLDTILYDLDPNIYLIFGFLDPYFLWIICSQILFRYIKQSILMRLGISYTVDTPIKVVPLLRPQDYKNFMSIKTTKRFRYLYFLKYIVCA